MLKRQHRLISPVRLQSPTTVTTSAFIAKIASNNLSVSRFGFLVRKALDKRSTHRNRARRIFRSCIEDMLTQIKPGYDMLFILQKRSLEAKYSELYQEIKSELQKRDLFI